MGEVGVGEVDSLEGKGEVDSFEGVEGAVAATERSCSIQEAEAQRAGSRSFRSRLMEGAGYGPCSEQVTERS